MDLHTLQNIDNPLFKLILQYTTKKMIENIIYRDMKTRSNILTNKYRLQTNSLTYSGSILFRQKSLSENIINGDIITHFKFNGKPSIYSKP